MECASRFLFVIILLLTYCCSEAQVCKYAALENSLIETDENTHNLSRAFFPPVDNPPEFVQVNYAFSETAKTQSWCWSVTTSSFIHPPELLQFMSLFFAKPYIFYYGSVEVVLTSTNSGTVTGCADDLSKMQLLTQRVSD